MSAFILVLTAAILSSLIFLLLWFLERVKNKRMRLKVTIIGGALLVDLITIPMMAENHQRRIGDLVGLAILNLMFASFYWLGTRFESWGYAQSLDLNLKDQPWTEIRVARCPNCSKRTISRQHAIVYPQTCGECGKKYKMTRSSTAEALNFLWMFMVGFGTLYLWAKGLIPKWAVWVALFVAVIGGVFIARKKQNLMEVQE